MAIRLCELSMRLSNAYLISNTAEDRPPKIYANAFAVRNTLAGHYGVHVGYRY